MKANKKHPARRYIDSGIEAKKLITKSELARRWKCTPTQINREMDKKNISAVMTLDGQELCYLD